LDFGREEGYRLTAGEEAGEPHIVRVLGCRETSLSHDVA
jgi:hypothetical protein